MVTGRPGDRALRQLRTRHRSRPGPLTHTWFLAVMAHFYLLWPLVITSLPAKNRLRAIFILALAAIAWRVTFLSTELALWVALPLSVIAGAASWYLIEKPPLDLASRLEERAE